jgi:mRNA-degrading endonuclease RelE of RelBE toxin-antitoxin system
MCMSYVIILTNRFKKDIEFYFKKRKYSHVIDDIYKVVGQLQEGNLIGTPQNNLSLPEGEVVYKVRTVNTDTKSGKSNGYRIIYYVIKDDKEIYLLTVYYKKDKENVSTKEILSLIEEQITEP